MTKVMIALFLLSTALRVHGVAQGLCVIDEMPVQTIRGTVTDPNGFPISDATIELVRKGGDGSIIAEVATDDSGCFAIRDIKPGRYEIAARYPSFKGLYVPVRVIRKTKTNKQRREIVIVLNGLMDKPCGGGTAHLRSRVR